MTQRPVSKPIRITLSAAIAALSLSGCMSLSGLGGTSNYACKAPDGVTCDSVAGTYANAVQHNLPSQRTRRHAGSGDAETPQPAPPSQAAAAWFAPSQVPLTAQALRSQARVLRLWFKPWEDADRDLYDQGYVYVQIDSGQWLIEHMQRQIRDAYAPLRPPPKSETSASPPEARQAPSLPARPEAPQRPAITPDSLLPPMPAPTHGNP